MINTAKVSAADGRAGASRAGASARRAAIFAAIVISSLGAATLSGCSSSPAAPALVAAARPPGAAAKAGTPAAPATPAPAAAPGAPGPVSPASGSLRAITTYVKSAPDLTPGGPPMLFTVVVSNTTTQTYSNIEPLVVIGHCSCTSASVFPEGTLQERSEGGSWRNVDYDTMGFGTDFLYASQQPGIDLPPGATVSFECRLAIGPNSGLSMTRGSSSIGVLLEALPAHTEIRSAIANDVHIEVLPAKPA